MQAQVQQAHQLVAAIRDQLNSVVVGQSTVIDEVLIGFLAGGHVLIEGVPGLGKTLLVRCLAGCFGGNFARVQFTPDLMPSDVTGHAMYNMQEQTFTVRKGPVFTNLLLADEINRAPAKTQAALLEVMQEQQVTIEGTAYRVSDPFMVLATQNPIEMEGTYPLPEAELDRFLLKIFIDYPRPEDENILVKLATTQTHGFGFDIGRITKIIELPQVVELQQLTTRLVVDDAVVDYAVRIVNATRDWPGVSKGAGPRGSIAIIRSAKAHALLQGREFVMPDDVKMVARAALRHRLWLSADMEIEGFNADTILSSILEDVQTPR